MILERRDGESPARVRNEPSPGRPAVGGGDGSGWMVPLELDADGGFVEERPRKVADSARLVLEIVPGERPLLPQFGCSLHRVPVLESASELHLAASLAEESLERWLPWLHVERVEAVSCEEGILALRLLVAGEWHEVAVRHRSQRGGRP